MLLELPPPLPTKIERIAPSEANNLLQCALRVGFARDDRFEGWRRPNTFSALGQVAHHVIVEAFRLNLDDQEQRRAHLEDEWERAVDNSAKQLATAWRPAVPPPPAEWPGYQLTRVRTLRRGARAAPSTPAEPRPRHRIAGFERWMEAPDSILQGRADRIEYQDGQLRVIDLKTGIHQAGPTEPQIRQLLPYSVLVHRIEGVWPTEIAIEDTSGGQTSMTLEPTAAARAEHDVLRAVAEFNANVANGGLAASAEPDADRCRWCPFRVVCQPYWKFMSNAWEHASVAGRIVHSGITAEGAHVTVAVEAPFDHQERTIQVSSLPVDVPASATWFAAADLRRVHGRSDLRAEWSSLINFV